MSSNYNYYLEYLASFADSHSLAVQAERNIYPLFSDLKRLINHYSDTIKKFPNVQDELVYFIDKLEFDDNDFDYYHEMFKKLRKIDDYLQELKAKQIPVSISENTQEFIDNTYIFTSLYDLEKIEEKVLSFHNQATEVKRYEQYQKNKKEQNVTSIIIGIVVVLVIISLIAQCSG